MVNLLSNRVISFTMDITNIKCISFVKFLLKIYIYTVLNIKEEMYYKEEGSE